ncbi:pseudouridine synthase [Thermodesulfobacteriota bacterium]
MEKRIQLIIRDAGLASRRQAEEMILDGRVTLNGKVVDVPSQKANPEKDHIKIDGKLLHLDLQEKLYYLFNKPANVVSTLDDPQGRPCVADYIKAIRKRLFTVGRLDFDAEGLMILTNDGAFAQRLSHPSKKVARTYMVKVKGVPKIVDLAKIREGMSIGNYERVGKIELTVVKRQKTTSWIKVTLYEGKKNEIKRIFMRIRHPVRRIRRTGFGPFSLGKIPSGTWRVMNESELAKVAGLLGS